MSELPNIPPPASAFAPGWTTARQPCPYLPAAAALDWRDLHAHRGQSGPGLYLTALTYAQTLWQRGFTARAILALDRALFARLDGSEPVLATWPLPYRALAWIVREHPGDTFLGNPRISFQHLADRVRGPDRARRQARAWAAWYLVRQARPDLPGDPTHAVAEPAAEDVVAALNAHGHPGEAATWQALADELPTVLPLPPGLHDRS